MTDKLKMHSPNGVEQNIEKIAELFPNCITEAADEQGNIKQAIDFDRLRQELSEHIVEGPRERYQLDWPGKREAMLAANAPIAKTLRPCREESVDFDSTQNLFIEGDNLEALKLLQETYLNKVKMIYIDPPYNRRKGNDLIYRDDYVIDGHSFSIALGEEDESGIGLVANSDSNGRFHSDWLTMMSARLKTARNLLSPDGVVIVSLDDAEISNLRLLCSEIFGEENFVGCGIWKNVTDNNPTNIATEHEYLLVYCKSRANLAKVWKSAISDVKSVLLLKEQELLSGNQDPDMLAREYSEWFREYRQQVWPLDGYKFIDEGGIYAGIRGVHNPGKDGYFYDVIHPETGQACKAPLMGYRFPEETMKRLLADGKILFGEDHTKLIELKVYAKDYSDKFASVLDMDGRSGAYDLRKLFPEFKKAFDNPKPVKLLQRIISFVTQEDGDIVCDFFAGSASTAHGVLETNLLDGKSRRFILVQFEEPCSPKSEPAKAGVEFVSEISKERIRRAGKKIKEENGEKAANSDTGFRVLKIDSSNMKDVYYAPDKVAQGDLLGQVDNIKDDRSDEDLLFQVMLDWGVDLALPITEQSIEGRKVWFVDENAIAACFETDLDEDFVKALAKTAPLRAVFRDAGFSNDSSRINVDQIFKLMSSSTDVKCI